MASVNIQERVAASADQVWQLMADFAGLGKWVDPALIERVDCDGTKVGAIRTLTLPGGATLRERLESSDAEARRYSYAILGKSPLPVTHYVATVKISELDSASCQVDWQSTFEPVGPAADAEKLVHGIYTGGVAGVRKTLGV